MSKSRLEAFSDGVFAIIITIIVLELKTPTSAGWDAILNRDWIWKMLAYVISFVLTASFWVSHHRIINTVKKVTTRLLWLNMVAIFPISLLPMTTAWFGEFPTAVAPSIVYAFDYLLTILALYFLARYTFQQVEDPKQRARMERVNNSRLYLVAIGVVALITAFFLPVVTGILILFVTGGWIVRALLRSER